MIRCCPVLPNQRLWLGGRCEGPERTSTKLRCWPWSSPPRHPQQDFRWAERYLAMAQLHPKPQLILARQQLHESKSHRAGQEEMTAAVDTRSSKYEEPVQQLLHAAGTSPGLGQGAKDAPGAQGAFRLFTAIKEMAAQEISQTPVPPLCPRPLHLHPGWDAAGRGDALGRDTDRGSRILTLLTVGSGNKCSQERLPRGSASVRVVLVWVRRAQPCCPRVIRHHV